MLSVHRRERWIVMLHLLKHVHEDLIKDKVKTRTNISMNTTGVGRPEAKFIDSTRLHLKLFHWH